MLQGGLCSFETRSAVEGGERPRLGSGDDVDGVAVARAEARQERRGRVAGLGRCLHLDCPGVVGEATSAESWWVRVAHRWDVREGEVAKAVTRGVLRTAVVPVPVDVAAVEASMTAAAAAAALTVVETGDEGMRTS